MNDPIIIRMAAIVRCTVAAAVFTGALSAAEPIPILNGDFESDAGWTLSDNTKIVTDGGTRVLRLTTAEPGNASATQQLDLDPAWGTLRFKYRVRVNAIAPGKESWNNARIALTIFGPENKVTHTIAGEWKRPTEGWVDAAVSVNIPVGATYVKISPALFASVGDWMLDDFTVELLANRGEGIDADIPAGMTLTWGKEPIEDLNAKRSVICLNGLWQFQPAKGPAAAAPQSSGRGWIRVPGSWRGNPMPCLTIGNGPAWDGFNFDAPAAWYGRDITVPAAWAGRKIVLDITRVSTDAAVYLLGKEIGRVSWPGGEVDITAAVEAGRTYKLRIKVVATSDAAEVTRFMGMGEGQQIKEKAVLTTRGIIGDVLLASRPAGAVISSCTIRTSVREKRISIEADTTAASGSTSLSAIIRDAKGAIVKRFTAASDIAADGTVRASWDWSDPQLWDIDTPVLYTMELTASGGGLDDTITERFGFREFRVDGKRLLLNEKEIRLRPAPIHAESPISGTRELITAALEGIKWAGFNAYEMWPWDRLERGSTEFDELWCAEADRLGILLITPALSQGQFVSDWTKPGMKEGWASRMTPLLKRLINHPSIICWVTGANRFGHGQDQNPEAIGSKSRGSLPEPGWKRSAEYGEDASAMIKRVDPTRPVFMHAGSAVGDLYTINNYLCLIPLQEREEWLSRYAAEGDMPVMMVEFGTPLYTTFHRGRRGYGQASTSEPLYSEFLAIYQGADAYRMETPAYRGLVSSTFEKEFLWKTWHSIEAPRIHEGFNQLQALFSRNTYRTWRTWGISGGILPWGNGHGWLKESGGGSNMEPFSPKTVTLPKFAPGTRGYWRPEATYGLFNYFRPEGMPITSGGYAIISNNSETLAWIGGSPKFTDKTHNFRPGEKVTKQIIIISDARSPKKYSGTWSVDLNGTIASGKIEGTAEPSSTRSLPVQFSIPVKAARADGTIRLTCTIGNFTHTDNFVFRVYSPDSAALPSVSVLDAGGDTASMLRSLGAAATAWNGEAGKLLVIGRNACASGNADLAAVEKFVRSGGRALIMAQDPEWMRKRLGLRVSRQMTRRAFPMAGGHRALQGIDADALRDWAGESRLIPPTDTALSASMLNRTPDYGWRWGSTHAVSSAAIEVPHRAGWRPLIACEFDSAYTPLAEISLGKGTLTVCMLDLEDHIVDPAAELIARNIIIAASAAKVEERAASFYLGRDAGAILSASGILASSAASIPERGLLFIGADASVDDAALESFLRRGNNAVILPRRTDTAPLGIRLAKKDKHSGSLAIPSWSSTRGIMPGELRRRTDGEAWIIASGADAVGADGLLAEVRRGGTAVFFQPDAAALDADRLTYNRITRWRFTRALAQIAANLGAALEGDTRMLRPIPPPERIPLTEGWKAALITPYPPAGANDTKPKDPGISDRARALTAKDADESSMQDVAVSKEWENYGGAWSTTDGEGVFRKTFEIPEAWAGRDLIVSLGAVDDFDTAFFDGEAIGSTDINVKNFWSAPRLYTIPARLATAGKHVLAVRVFDHFGGGGLVGKPEEFALTPKEPINPPPASMYHPDWKNDFPQGDDPYRYYRW